MTRQQVSRTNQYSKSETPLVSGILQRAAVRSVPEQEVQPSEDTESSTFQESRFHHDFSGIPAHTLSPQGRPTATATPKIPSLATGAGKTMPEPVQQKMEAAFGTDFSDVRIHEGQEAKEIGATAFTHGSHLHFAAGQYNPTSESGQRLLGHELTHVVQQRAGRVTIPQGKGMPINADPKLEGEADEMGTKAARSEPVKVRGAGVGLQRQAVVGGGGAIQCQGETTSSKDDEKRRSEAKHVFINGMFNTEKGAEESRQSLESELGNLGVTGKVSKVTDPSFLGGVGDPFKYIYYRFGGQTEATKKIGNKIEKAVENKQPVVFHSHSQGNAAYNSGRGSAINNIATQNMSQFENTPGVQKAVADAETISRLMGEDVPLGLPEFTGGMQQIREARADATEKVKNVTHQIATGSSMTPNPTFHTDLIAPENLGPSPLMKSHVTDPVPALTTKHLSQGNVIYHPIPSLGSFGFGNHPYTKQYVKDDARITRDAMLRRGWLQKNDDEKIEELNI